VDRDEDGDIGNVERTVFACSLICDWKARIAFSMDSSDCS